MRGRIARKRANCCLELRDGAFQISGVQQPLARIGREKRSLLIRLLFSNFSSHFGFDCGSLVVAELAKHRRQSGVRAGKIGLQADRLPQLWWVIWVLL